MSLMWIKNKHGSFLLLVSLWLWMKTKIIEIGFKLLRSQMTIIIITLKEISSKQLNTNSLFSFFSFCFFFLFNKVTWGHFTSMGKIKWAWDPPKNLVMKCGQRCFSLSYIPVALDKSQGNSHWYQNTNFSGRYYHTKFNNIMKSIHRLLNIGQQQRFLM